MDLSSTIGLVFVLAVLYLLSKRGSKPSRQRYQLCAWCDRTYWCADRPLRECPGCGEKLPPPKRLHPR